MEYGLDERHLAVCRPESDLSALQSPADHLLIRLCLVGEFHPADLARRGGAREALAARQDARRRLAEAREFSSLPELHVRPSRQEAVVHGLGIRAVAGMARREPARVVAI